MSLWHWLFIALFAFSAIRLIQTERWFVGVIVGVVTVVAIVLTVTGILPAFLGKS